MKAKKEARQDRIRFAKGKYLGFGSGRYSIETAARWGEECRGLACHGTPYVTVWAFMLRIIAHKS